MGWEQEQQHFVFMTLFAIAVATFTVLVCLVLLKSCAQKRLEDRLAAIEAKKVAKELTGNTPNL